MKPRSTSKACSPGLLDVSSTMMSYFVRGRCSCSNESKAPWIIKELVNQHIHVAKQHPTDPFAIDSHFLFRWDIKMLDFADVPHLLHVRSIATGSENDTDLRMRVNVVRGNKCSCRIVDECSHSDRYALEGAGVRDGWSTRNSYPPALQVIVGTSQQHHDLLCSQHQTLWSSE